MTDYTPTTEEVSGAYNFWLQQCSGETVEEITEKFDRWLVAERKRVAAMAIERFAKDVNRIEVIDKNGRVYVKYNKQVEVLLQDNGTTLKVFVKDKNEQPN